MRERRCMSCMKIVPENTDICPYCQFDQTHYQAKPYGLLPGTMLSNGRYQTGCVIKETGFGLTYAAWDRQREERVLIREFYPKAMVRDEREKDVVRAEEVYEQSYEEMLRQAEKEAVLLARSDCTPAVMKVKDCFSENNTVYIVLEYAEGITFGEYLKKNGDILKTDTVLKLFLPLLQSLRQLHRMNFIHRYISPDNILYQKDGTLKLIVFGEVRSAELDGKLMTIKFGYAPAEQYYAKAENQGPWIDVYAVSVCIYNSLTGIRMKDSMNRTQKENIWKGTSVKLSKRQKDTLKRGLEPDYRKRIQSMDDLIDGLYQKKPWPGKLAAGAAVLLICLAAAGYGASRLLQDGEKTVEYSDGSRYEGEMADGVRSGTGVYYWPDGARYEGEWQEDKRKGVGTMYYAEDDADGRQRCEGEWNDNKCNGTIYYSSGDSEKITEWQ